MEQRILSFGEVLLRLTPPDYETIAVAGSFMAHYGGSEANIAVSLANLGVNSSFFTVLPGNALGKSVIRMLRGNAVNCESIILSTPEQTPTHRLGTYYLEAGYGVRPSQVTYDRKHSAISEFDFSTVDIGALLEGYTWLHLGGITPALSPGCARFTLDCLKKAKEKGITVSFDGNFRSKLWNWEEARDFCTKCLPYVDVLMGTEPYHLWKDEDDHSKGDWKDNTGSHPNFQLQNEEFRHFAERYPNLKCISRHVREAHSGSKNSLMAFLWYEGKTYESRMLTFDILDRVGGGDAFDSGLIYAIMNGYDPADMVNFAVAASAIKHTIHGDGNITDDAEAIRSLMNMNFDIKR